MEFTHKDPNFISEKNKKLKQYARKDVSNEGLDLIFMCFGFLTEIFGYPDGKQGILADPDPLFQDFTENKPETQAIYKKNIYLMKRNCITLKCLFCVFIY
ncbi:hypothetical protein Hanom_Chr16g01460871 [Helianthus anomalus]